MKIELKKFGAILISRPAGREAFLVMQSSMLVGLSGNEPVVINFEGVNVLTPSWADEVVTKLAENHPIEVENAENPSVRETLKTLTKYSGLILK